MKARFYKCINRLPLDNWLLHGNVAWQMLYCARFIWTIDWLQHSHKSQTQGLTEEKKQKKLTKWVQQIVLFSIHLMNIDLCLNLNLFYTCSIIYMSVEVWDSKMPPSFDFQPMKRFKKTLFHLFLKKRWPENIKISVIWPYNMYFRFVSLKTCTNLQPLYLQLFKIKKFTKCQYEHTYFGIEGNIFKQFQTTTTKMST